MPDTKIEPHGLRLAWYAVVWAWSFLCWAAVCFIFPDWLFRSRLGYAVLPWAGLYGYSGGWPAYIRGRSLAYYDNRLDLIVVPRGACPYPLAGDDGTARSCIEHGNCGCDESRQFPEPSHV